MSSIPLSPHRPPARLQAVDTLRGFALLGILVVNSAAFSTPYYGSGVEDPSFPDLISDMVRFGMTALFEAKFYLLFSFLFGYSFTLQLASAERAGRPPLPPFLRRLAMLLALGIAHACLLYTGDILTIYALIGLLLIPLRHRPHWLCLTLAVGLIAIMAVGLIGIYLLELAAGQAMSTPAEAAATAERALSSYQDGILATIRFNISEWTNGIWLFLFLYQGPHALAMFLLGLVAGQRGLLQDGVLSSQTLKRIALLGLPMGLIGSITYAAAQTANINPKLVAMAAGMADLLAPAQTTGYGAVLLLCLRQFPASRLAAGVAAAGRMALTNYLSQSLVCAIVFTGYGWAASGTVSPGITLLFAIGLYSAQIALSSLWLRLYQQGPAECLLRAVTHWQVPRLVRVSGQKAFQES